MTALDATPALDALAIDPLAIDPLAIDADTEVVFVPHTHWDREWYEPFQRFRFRLVEMFDEVLDRLEHDSGFHFTLDGQTAAIEDYLEIRPEHRQRVIDRVDTGQLALGPFHILLDEFLCSAETTVRNLQIGTAGAEALGGAMRIGYLPDMFGHIAQMPQILRQAGLAHAAMWRGIPAHVATHGFDWIAPSGDAVRVEYLFDGYGNGLDLTADLDRIGDRVVDYRTRTSARWGDEPILAMVGSDHTAPDPRLMTALRAAQGHGLRCAVATVEQYVLGRAPATDRVEGELRCHARGNILPGVISIRRPLKQAMAEAERSILTAERVTAQWPSRDFGAFFDLAWRQVVESTAHDSVVGSGVDVTVRQVLTRLEEAEQIGRAIRDSALRGAAGDVPADGFAVFNTLPEARHVLVEVPVDAGAGDTGIVGADGVAHPTQVVGDLPTDLGDEVLDASELDRLVHRIHGRELFGQLIDDAEWGDRSLTFHVAVVPRRDSFDLGEFRRRLSAAAADQPGPWKVRTVSRRRLRVVAAVPVGPMGRTAIRDTSASALGAVAPVEVADPVEVTESGAGVRLSNRLLAVTVGPDGLATVVGADGVRIERVGAIVDGGDRGDSYNYGPPADDELVGTPTSVDVTVEHAGPLLGVVAVRRWYQWPTGLGDSPDKRSGESVPAEVLTRYELRAGEPMVRVDVRFVNQMRNHRTRFHVPLPAAVDHSEAMGQFSVTSRGLTAEGGGGEFPLPTYPAYEFVSAGDVTVLVRHATEFEVIDDGRELALTMLRAVGMISVNVHPLRDEPAASEIPIPEGQEIGTEINASFAILVNEGGWQAADAVGWSQRWLADPVVVPGTARRGEPLPLPTSGVAVSGPAIGVSAWRVDAGGSHEFRLVNYSSAVGAATITGGYADVVAIDLLGRPADRPRPRQIDGGWEVDLEPFTFATLRATPAG